MSAVILAGAVAKTVGIILAVVLLLGVLLGLAVNRR
jgi:hypothetical protein